MRLYFDENFSPSFIAGLKLMQKGRPGDDIEVHSTVEDFGQGTPDEDWIAQVAIRHGVAITQDLNIHRYQAQWELCKLHKIGIIFLKPLRKGSWSYWEIAAFMLGKWTTIQKVAKEGRKPFGYVLEYSTGKLRPL